MKAEDKEEIQIMISNAVAEYAKGVNQQLQKLSDTMHEHHNHLKQEVANVQLKSDPEMMERIQAMEDHANRHKGGPSPRKWTEEEIQQLEEMMKEARKNAAPPRR